MLKSSTYPIDEENNLEYGGVSLVSNMAVHTWLAKATAWLRRIHIQECNAIEMNISYHCKEKNINIQLKTV